MGAQLRVYRQPIKLPQTTKKITRAMELISASRIQKAQARVEASAPYARAVTRAVSAVATYSNVDHVLTTEPEKIDARRDRRLLLGPRSRRRLQLERAAQEPRSSPSCCAARARRSSTTWSAARRAATSASAGARSSSEWTGGTDSPDVRARRRRSREALVEKFIQDADEGGVDEIHIVYNRFVAMLTQDARDRAPAAARGRRGRRGARTSTRCCRCTSSSPTPATVLDALLPVYIE